MHLQKALSAYALHKQNGPITLTASQDMPIPLPDSPTKMTNLVVIWSPRVQHRVDLDPCMARYIAAAGYI